MTTPIVDGVGNIVESVRIEIGDEPVVPVMRMRFSPLDRAFAGPWKCPRCSTFSTNEELARAKRYVYVPFWFDCEPSCRVDSMRSTDDRNAADADLAPSIGKRSENPHSFDSTTRSPATRSNIS